MSVYPYGTPAEGVFDIFTSNFSPNDVVRGIRDNYSAVNRTTMLNSLGYQVGLIQNFVNSSYLGREDVPVTNAYMTSGWADDFISLSGSFSASAAHQYSWLTNSGIYIFKRTGGLSTCGSSLTSSEFKIYQTSSLAADTWSGYWNRNELVSDTFSLINAVSSNSYVSTLKANKSKKFLISNPSYTDDGVGYSGILELYANNIYLESRNHIYLGGSAFGSTYLSFCGTNLVLSGSSNAGSVFLYNNLIPLSHGEKVIGDDVRYFKTGYIQEIQSTAQLTGAPGGASSSAGFYATFGAVCGTNFATGTNGLYIQVDYVCGAYLHNKTLVDANRIALYQYQTGIAAGSGHFQMMSGQLEFYSYNYGSGWVITNFA